jgi:hypothetical protein
MRLAWAIFCTFLGLACSAIFVFHWWTASPVDFAILWFAIYGIVSWVSIAWNKVADAKGKT